MEEIQKQAFQDSTLASNFFVPLTTNVDESNKASFTNARFNDGTPFVLRNHREETHVDSSVKTFATENDLINAIKGFANDPAKNVEVDEIVKYGSNKPFIVTQTYFDARKIRSSYKGTFSSDDKKNQFIAITTEVKDNRFKDESNLTFISLPQVTIVAENAFANSPITSLFIPFASTIGDNAFKSIVNDPSTQVTLPSTFNSDDKKDKIFGAGN
ncbi:MAG: hypothetical protein DSZ21_01050 [Tenericutes bacterium]|nr:MAG: hypothetical protein DSZ21_01050 [Mycoplasmatota bacterium]